MAGARQSGNSKHRRLQSERYGGRKVAVRKTLPIIAIVCDDTATAPRYFRALKGELQKNVVALKIVHASRKGASPSMVVTQAIYEYNELKEHSGDESDVTIVWAVLDLEHEKPRPEQAQNAKRFAESKGVKVALSNPCFEVWTLLHLEDTGKRFEDCGEVTDHVNQIWKKRFGQSFIPKAQADFSKIIDQRHKAKERAKKHRESDDPSWTEVYKIIEDIESIVQGADTKAKDSGKNRMNG